MVSLIFRPSSLGAILLSVALAAGCSSSSSSTDPTPPLPSGSSSEMQGADGVSARKPDPREQTLSGAVASLLRLQHLSQKEIDDELSLMSYDHFLETIDPDKLFLLQEDVDLLAKSKSRFDDELLSGNLEVAHLANALFLRRLKTVESKVAEYLSGPIDLTKEEYRETDSEKLGYAKSEAELGERWGRALKLEILGRIHRMGLRSESLAKALEEDAKSGKKLTGEEAEAHAKKIDTLKKALAKIPSDEAGRIAKAQADVKKAYTARFIRLADVDALTPAANFINAITGSFDPHTVYLPPTEKENFDISMSGSLEGIGAVLVEQDQYIGVNEIVVGGAAWRQGDLKAGDLILSVTQEDGDGKAVDVGNMKINKVVKLIRGPKGTTVTLTVEKEDKSIQSISIVRDKVEIDDSYARAVIIKNNGKAPVGYINLPSFYGDTRRDAGNDARYSASDVRKILQIMEGRKVPGLVLDLRQNGGGLLDDARKMTGFFIKRGPVVQTQLPDGTVEVLSDRNDDLNYSGKVVVLIDKFSASASEIVAAALQDYDRAVIVGPGPTHGKGTVQGLLDLDRANESASDPPLGVLKLTVQQFFRINGSSTQKRGVEPDIAFPDSLKYLETGERNLDNALPWREVDALSYEKWKHSDWNKADLLAKSQERQAKSSYFTVLDKRGKLLKERRDDSRIPLRRSDYEARTKKQQEELDALSPEDDETRKPFFEVSYLPYAAPSKNPDEQKAEKEKIDSMMEILARDPVVNESVLILRDML